MSINHKEKLPSIMIGVMSINNLKEFEAYKAYKSLCGLYLKKGEKDKLHEICIKYNITIYFSIHILIVFIFVHNRTLPLILQQKLCQKRKVLIFNES